MMNGIPEGKMRDAALKRIVTLDCGDPEKLPTCNSAAAPPPWVLLWQWELKAASVDEAVFAKALTKELRGLVCVNDTNAIHILRGLIENPRLPVTGPEAPALVDFIMSMNCPVFASLAADDKAKLLLIKQVAEEHFPPAPAPKKEN
ncbi:MAG: hypothetical protein ACLP4V_22905 [Methylocella sp.]